MKGIFIFLLKFFIVYIYICILIWINDCRVPNSDFGFNPNIWAEQLTEVQVTVIRAEKKKSSACTKSKVLYTGVDISICYYMVQSKEPFSHFSTWKLVLASCSCFLHENCMYFDICIMHAVFGCCQITVLFVLGLGSSFIGEQTVCYDTWWQNYVFSTLRSRKRNDGNLSTCIRELT